MRNPFKEFVFFISLFFCIFTGGNLYSLTIPDTSRIVISNIRISGNKITKESIISREITISKGDTLSDSQLDQLILKSKENLLNTSLFNFVNISLDSLSVLNINLVERWYTWVYPIFEFSERNFNVWLDEMDWDRINYGFFLMRDNCRGRKESLRFVMRFGYDELVGVSYKIPYINKKQTLGVSFLASYSRNHEIAVKSEQNKFINFRHSDHARSSRLESLTLLYRPQINTTHTFSIGDEGISIEDTVFSLNSQYFEGKIPDRKSKQTFNYGMFSYNFKDDHRDNKAYPLKGYYVETELQYRKNYQDEKSLYSLKMQGKNFFKINNRWNFSGSAGLYLEDGGYSSFYLSKGMGFGNDFVRGYEMYITKGSYALGKFALKYNLIKEHVGVWSFISNQKFKKYHYALYLNAFTDLGKDFKGTNADFLHKDLMMGNGIGLDFVTYYDKVFRLELTRNRIGEFGYFLHFIAPI